MSDLTDFLLARIAEDEATARAATDDGHVWLLEEETISLWPDDREPADGFITFPRKAHALHAATWAPSRVLTECEAKRRIVAAHGPWVDGDPYCGSCGDVPQVEVPCATLRLLALPYADHPDYREEWRP